VDNPNNTVANIVRFILILLLNWTLYPLTTIEIALSMPQDKINRNQRSLSH
jgi:hypothetical protein